MTENASKPPTPLMPVWPDTGQALGGLGRTKVFELIKNGDLRSVLIGSRRFVVTESVAEYVRRLDAEQNGPTP